jgi:predicted GIY-YIG superfamily endonuclease
MAYCITTHVSQGSTYDFPYSIYEYRYFNKKLLYTAMSRSTQKSNINFIDICLEPVIGYIYKITDNNNKVYIGSSTNPTQRWEQHKTTIDTSPLHTAMQSEGIEFTFEVIDTVEYIDVEQLLIKESVLMNEYNSIETGYNTKHSIQLQDLY